MPRQTKNNCSPKEICAKKVIICDARAEEAYAHLVYFSTQEQIVPLFPDGQNYVLFNQQENSKNITHPVNGDQTRFRVEVAGVYEVNWILNSVAQLLRFPAGELLQFAGGAFEVEINGDRGAFQQIGQYTFPADSPEGTARPQVTGQHLLRLNAGDVLRLRFSKLAVPNGLTVEQLVIILSESFSDVEPFFRCIGASLLIKKIADL